MSVYVISEVRVRDEQLADRYRSLAAASIARYGGRYLVRGAVPVMLEGEWSEQERVVVVEFPDAATARSWYDSAEYAEALAIRQDALGRRLLLVEGVEGTAAVSSS